MLSMLSTMSYDYKGNCTKTRPALCIKTALLSPSHIHILSHQLWLLLKQYIPLITRSDTYA